MNEGPRRRTLTISDSFGVRGIHSSFHLLSYRTPVPHVILTLNIIREAENLVPNQWQKVTDTQQHRPVIGQRFCGSNPLSTVVNLLHCRLLSPDPTDCTPRASQSPVKYCCLSGTSQLQFSSFCLAKMSYNATHI